MVYRDLSDLNSFDVYRFCQFLRNSNTGCIEWQGCTSDGYGQFKIGGKNGLGFYAHRIAYWLSTGRKPPTHLQVCHHCDNPPCCNPEHLYLDTCAGNIDKAAKEGHMHGTPKITPGDVVEIRKKGAAGMSTKELAILYSLARGTVRSILSHRTWKNIGGPIVKRSGGFSKLTLEQVRYIRNNQATGVELARQFGVSTGTISNVRTNRTFKNYNGDLMDV